MAIALAGLGTSTRGASRCGSVWNGCHDDEICRHPAPRSFAASFSFSAMKGQKSVDLVYTEGKHDHLALRVRHVKDTVVLTRGEKLSREQHGWEKTLPFRGDCRGSGRKRPGGQEEEQKDGEEPLRGAQSMSHRVSRGTYCFPNSGTTGTFHPGCR